MFVEIHEKLAVDFLASKMSYDITFLVPNRRKGAKTPDIEMDGRIPTQRHIQEIERRFNDARAIRHIIVITRQDASIDFKR